MNYNLLRRTIQNLKDEYDRNHEFMEDHERLQLIDDINDLIKLLDTYKVEIEENYCETTDKTFIIEYTLADGNLVSAECLGWYHGEPTPEDTATYSRHGLRAVYTL